MRLAPPALATLAALVSAAVALPAQAPASRHLTDLNWMEVAELVPARTTTVLLPVGTLEAHGVIANGADILVPDSMALRLAARLDALVAPTINYGVNAGIDEYPGTFGVSAQSLEATAEQVMRGLARAGFREIIVLNGHGPNYGPLGDAARTVFRETDARILVVNWWSVTADITEAVFGTEGGHAGNNETAAVLALRPDLVHPERYTGEGMTTPNGLGWQAWPFPSTVGLYAAGEGFPEFDRAKAIRYFDLVLDRMAELITDVRSKWARGGH